jgi:hypothetical protein
MMMSFGAILDQPAFLDRTAAYQQQIGKRRYAGQPACLSPLSSEVHENIE